MEVAYPTQWRSTQTLADVFAEAIEKALPQDACDPHLRPPKQVRHTADRPEAAGEPYRNLFAGNVRSTRRERSQGLGSAFNEPFKFALEDTTC